MADNEHRVSNEDYALLSRDAYFGAEDKDKFKKVASAGGWKELEIEFGEPKDKYFSARAYKNDDGEVVIAYRGTDDIPGEYAAGGQILYGNVPDQFVDAYHFYQRVLEEEGVSKDKVSFTGHSLGGALATMMAEHQGMKAVVFASPPNAVASEKASKGVWSGKIRREYTQIFANFPLLNPKDYPIERFYTEKGYDLEDAVKNGHYIPPADKSRSKAQIDHFYINDEILNENFEGKRLGNQHALAPDFEVSNYWERYRSVNDMFVEKVFNSLTLPYSVYRALYGEGDGNEPLPYRSDDPVKSRHLALHSMSLHMALMFSEDLRQATNTSDIALPVLLNANVAQNLGYETNAEMLDDMTRVVASARGKQYKSLLDGLAADINILEEQRAAMLAKDQGGRKRSHSADVFAVSRLQDAVAYAVNETQYDLPFARDSVRQAMRNKPSTDDLILDIRPFDEDDGIPTDELGPIGAFDPAEERKIWEDFRRKTLRLKIESPDFSAPDPELEDHSNLSPELPGRTALNSSNTPQSSLASLTGSGWPTSLQQGLNGLQSAANTKNQSGPSQAFLSAIHPLTPAQAASIESGSVGGPHSDAYGRRYAPETNGLDRFSQIGAGSADTQIASPSGAPIGKRGTDAGRVQHPNKMQSPMWKKRPEDYNHIEDPGLRLAAIVEDSFAVRGRRPNRIRSPMWKKRPEDYNHIKDPGLLLAAILEDAFPVEDAFA